MNLARLWVAARRLKLGRITIEDLGQEWKAHSAAIGVPHDARGRTGIDALAELVRFAEAIERPKVRRRA